VNDTPPRNPAALARLQELGATFSYEKRETGRGREWKRARGFAGGTWWCRGGVKWAIEQGVTSSFLLKLE
jgi:hypothetical protein